MNEFIDDHHEAHWVEPLCTVLSITQSTYYDYVARCPSASLFGAEIVKPFVKCSALPILFRFRL